MRCTICLILTRAIDILRDMGPHALPALKRPEALLSENGDPDFRGQIRRGILAIEPHPLTRWREVDRGDPAGWYHAQRALPELWPQRWQAFREVCDVVRRQPTADEVKMLVSFGDAAIEELVRLCERDHEAWPFAKPRGRCASSPRSQSTPSRRCAKA